MSIRDWTVEYRLVELMSWHAVGVEDIGDSIVIIDRLSHSTKCV